MNTTQHDHNAMLMNTTTHNHHMHHGTTTTMHNHEHHMTTKGHDHGSMMDHQMMMYMHDGIKEIIVFPGWKTSNGGTFAVSCIALCIIAILYEGIKLFRDRITESRLQKRKINAKRVANDGNLKMNQLGSNGSNTVKLESKESTFHRYENYFDKLTSLDHVIQTVLHVIQFAISYFLMLAFMTYNYWLCLSILIGIAIGFFFFGVRRRKINLEEDCH